MLHTHFDIFQRLAPIWDELADAIPAELPVKIAKVDCTTSKDTCSTLGIRGYPTLLYFKAGETEPQKYAGGRTLEALKAFVEAQVA